MEIKFPRKIDISTAYYLLAAEAKKQGANCYQFISLEKKANTVVLALKVFYINNDAILINKQLDTNKEIVIITDAKLRSEELNYILNNQHQKIHYGFYNTKKAKLDTVNIIYVDAKYPIRFDSLHNFNSSYFQIWNSINQRVRENDYEKPKSKGNEGRKIATVLGGLSGRFLYNAATGTKGNEIISIKQIAPALGKLFIFIMHKEDTFKDTRMFKNY
jgi:hypothetical protein